ncbi:hypothetical protein OQZ33_21980 [Pedobacter sp. MC2016-05]|uniref:hypothetical protein n=1 Tax=Pedobacter sp. MC2016-05 TaxID=2994474 RepID=UPI0022474A75|nr:hypothetical protein [Pedobacter sp. MC2016-05]MCX2477019.1 hypothetical protein [Pedobacter sp. MC2016-05]
MCSFLERFFSLKTPLLIASLSLLYLNAFAQRSEVERVLSSYGISDVVLKSNPKENIKTTAYDLKQITSASSSEKIELASYDGSKAEGSRWELKSVNGKLPNTGQIKSFLKAHPDNPPIPVINEDTYKVVSKQDSMLIIEFSYLADKLTLENSFLKDCKGKLFINIKSKLLEKQEIENLTPLKIKGIKLVKLLTVSSFTFDKNLRCYVTSKEVTNFIIQLLLLTSDSVVTSEYSNYRRP